MGLQVPLAVRLTGAGSDRHVTRCLRDLSFAAHVPGGFTVAQFALDESLATQRDELNQFSNAYIYDARSGETMWEGRLEDPGREASNNGQVWDLTAIGPAGHAKDTTAPIVYVDQSFDGWQHTDRVPQGGRVGPSEAGDGRQTMTVQFPQGLAVPANGRVAIGYTRLVETGQRVARVAYTHRSGNAGSFSVQLLIRTAGALSSATVVRTDASSTTESAAIAATWGSTWASGTLANWAELRQLRAAAVTVGDDNAWAAFFGLTLLGSRYNAAGSEITTGYTDAGVYAHQIVADLLGRWLPRYDGAGAAITTSSFLIDQLAYMDGATPADILDDLMTFEDCFWAAWETNSSGKNRFEWSAWPTTVGLEADVTDGFDSPGSAADLYNAVKVRYRDAQGLTKYYTATQSVPVLTAAGLTRTAFVDLSDELGSAANATQVAGRFLADHAAPPNAGTLTVARPIVDLQRGVSLDPWQLARYAPGRLIRVRGVLPRVDALNATARDGVTVFRVVGASYQASDNTCRLELDSTPRTLDRLLARLAARQRRR